MDKQSLLLAFNFNNLNYQGKVTDNKKLVDTNNQNYLVEIFIKNSFNL